MKEVNQERVNSLITGIADFGKSEKGITRLAYSQEDFAAQKWLLEQIADLKLTVMNKINLLPVHAKIYGYILLALCLVCLAVIVTNDAWLPEHGGQLRMYLDEGAAYDVIPTGGCLVVFLSGELPHEVLPATRDRLSVTGWFRRRGNELF